MKRLIVAVVLVCIGGVAASAAEMSGSGQNMFVPKILESFQLPNDVMANRTLLKGFMTSDDPASPLALTSMTCSGVTIVDEEGARLSGGGTCDSVDTDGDVAFLWWKSKGTAGNWGFLGGTGKWEGVEGGGTYELNAYVWADGRFGNNWKGTWTMK